MREFQEFLPLMRKKVKREGVMPLIRKEVMM